MALQKRSRGTSSKTAADKSGAHAKPRRPRISRGNDAMVPEPAVPHPSKRHRFASESPAPAEASKKTKIVEPAQLVLAAVPSLPTITRAPVDILDVFVFGNGNFGELGLGTATDEAPRPRHNPFLDAATSSALHVMQLDCGGMHTIALSNDDQIVTWGVNDNGALGRNTTCEESMRDIDGEDSDELGDINPLESTPTAVLTTHFPQGTKFVQVAAGDSCSLALTDTGLVYGWGHSRVLTQQSPDGKETFGYDDSGALVERQTTPALVCGLVRITQVACGANHALALDADGVLWSWGRDDKKQLGRHTLNDDGPGSERRRGRALGAPLDPRTVGIRDVRYVAAGEYHSFAVDGRGNVWGWGLNSFGEAGYAKTAGSDEALLPHPIKIRDLCGKGVVCLGGGGHHSAAVAADGRCFTWGRLDGGQLGIEFSAEQLADKTLIRHDERGKPRICLRPALVEGLGDNTRFVACGTDHTIFVTGDGAAYATGFNGQAQLGLGDDADDDVYVVQRIRGKALEGRTLTWAGAGGQFSMVAGHAKSPGSS